MTFARFGGRWCVWAAVLISTYLGAFSVEAQTPATTLTGWPAPLSSEACWQRMPAAVDRSQPTLPTWIRMVAREMPKTAAAFLQLEHAQRTAGPVDAKLRAAMRWVAAQANGCKYTAEIAAFDAQRAGVASDQWQSLTSGDRSLWNESERHALEFAAGMTLDSDNVTDEQFTQLVNEFGERTAASMVLQMAYANFQDRLILCLGVELEPSDLAPPVAVSFSPDAFAPRPVAPSTNAVQPGAPPAQANPVEPAGDVIKEAESHTWLSYERLQQRLQVQRIRKTRLRIPDWQEFAERLPPGLMPSSSDIVWYKIVFGYAHELAIPFEIYMRTAGSEIAPNWDRSFGNALFWMVTNAVKCPYCMGHCEMNWEVAGLNRDKIAELSQKLASNDWSSYSAAEQQALDFARKLTQTPSQIGRAEIAALREGFGDQRAFFMAVNVSRYNYMTRISNGFQLTLESGNPFYQYYNMTAKPPAEVTDAPRPTPLRREEMKRWLEDMKQRRQRIALPELTEAERDSAANNGYEQRLTRTFLPNRADVRGYLFFGGSPNADPRPNDNRGNRTVDPALTLDYGFKTRLFWIASRVNNCQYCLGHQESKLLAVGMTDDQIGALDVDWSAFPEKEQVAFALARRLTLEPQRLSDADIDACRKHYSDLQILEMVLSVSGNNAINRWKEGIGVPQSSRGGNFGASNNDDHSYLTPTSPELAQKTSVILAGKIPSDAAEVIATTRVPSADGQPAKVEEMLAAVKTRTPRLPLVSAELTRSTFAGVELPTEIPHWLRALAHFPEAGKKQAMVLLAAERDLDLSDLTCARIAWVIARQNGAWYSLAQADRRLLALGQSRQQILELENFESTQSEETLTKRDRALLTVAKNLAASPVVLTDVQAQRAIELAGPREFVQTVHLTALRSMFDRFTEACRLPAE